MDNFNLRKYLVENTVTSNSKLIAEDLDLGNVAFGENPKMVNLQGADQEKNTEQESWLEATLSDWFTLGDETGEDSNARTARLAKLLMQYKGDLLKLKNKYPKVFMQPLKEKFAYRGTSVAPDAESIYKIIKQSKPVYITKAGSVFVPYIYRPKSPVQSWALSTEVALQYAEMYNEEVQAILIAKIDDSFWMNPAAATIFSGFEEDETLHFGQEVNTYVEFFPGGSDQTLLSILYDILEDKPLGTFEDEDVDINTVFNHPNFNVRYKELSGSRQLPW